MSSRRYLMISGDKFYYIAESTREPEMYRILPLQVDEYALARSICNLFEEHGAWKQAWPPFMTAGDIGVEEAAPPPPPGPKTRESEDAGGLGGIPEVRCEPYAENGARFMCAYCNKYHMHADVKDGEHRVAHCHTAMGRAAYPRGYVLRLDRPPPPAP